MYAKTVLTRPPQAKVFRLYATIQGKTPKLLVTSIQGKHPTGFGPESAWIVGEYATKNEAHDARCYLEGRRSRLRTAATRVALMATLMAGLGCAGAPPTLEHRGTSIYNMAPDRACIPPDITTTLDHIRDRVGGIDGIMDVAIEIYPTDHVFDIWSPEGVIGLYYHDENLIQMTYPHPRVLAHEFAHRAMHLLGYGNTPDNKNHEGLFTGLDHMISIGIPPFTWDVDLCEAHHAD